MKNNDFNRYCTDFSEPKSAGIADFRFFRQKTVSFYSLLPIFAALPREADPAKFAEMILWTLALVGTIILSFVILLRIRRKGKLVRSNLPDSEGEARLFRELHQKKLITDEEYNLIKRRLRDQLVENFLNPPSPPKRPSRIRSGRKTGVSIDKETRLRELLENPGSKR